MSKHRHGHSKPVRLSVEKTIAILQAVDIANEHLAAFEDEIGNSYLKFVEFLQKRIDAEPECKTAGVELLINSEKFYNACSDFVDAVRKSTALMVDDTDTHIFSLK